MSNKPHKPPVEFRTRKPSVPSAPRPPGPPAKRSGHVALFLMGTLAVGTSAYMLMPASNRCEQPPNATLPSNAAQPAQQPYNTNCPPRSSSSSSGGGGSGGSSSRSSYYSSDSSSSHSATSTSAAGTSNAARGGFGSFGHAVGFSGG